MESILQDVRYALRSLRRSPVFTIVAAITIGVGIGATTTIFSVANSILLRDPAGVRQTDELVTVHALSQDGSSFHSFSYPTYAELRDSPSGLSSLSAFGMFSSSLSTEGEPQLLLSMVVTGEYFQTLGTQPAIGRLMVPSDDRGAAGADAVVVLSYRTWTRRFGGDSGILGRIVQLNRQPFTVIGVAEPGFQGHTAGMDVAAWVPMGAVSQLRNEAPLDDPRSSWLELIGRRSANVSRASVAQRLNAASMAASQRLGRDSSGVDVRQYLPVPAQVVLPAGGFFGLLLIIGGVILFIGSVNVGGLLLSRATARSREIAIRLAIGARRSQLVRQLLTESLVLFAIGGSAGLALALVATRALSSFAPPLGIPLSFDFAPDLRVMTVALVLALVTGIVFGLVPALQSTRLDLAHAVRDEELGGRLRKSRLRNVFVAAQVAGSALLLVVGGLFVRALGKAGSIDLGFNPAGLHAVQADLRIHHYTTEQQIQFAAGVRNALLARPEISDVAGIDMLPLNMGNQQTVFQVPGREAVPDVGLFQTDFASVTPGYFQTMGIPLVKGRDFSDSDRAGTQVVGIVNEALARQAWPGEDALGKIIQFGGAQGDTRVEIVGVTRNSKIRTMGEDFVPALYMAYAQNPSDKLAMIARARGDITPVGGLLRQAIRDADPALPLLGDAPLATTIGVSLLPNRIAALLAGVFGAVGLILATVGLYGLLAFTVTRRRREIGIRMALGAQAGDVRRLVLGQGLRLTLIGLAIGFGLAFAATRFLGSLLFGVSPLDPVTFGAITLLLGLTAAIACIVPATRATRTDPMVAIRHD